MSEAEHFTFTNHQFIRPILDRHSPAHPAQMQLAIDRSLLFRISLKPKIP